jgi:hypothetical protein
VRLWFSRRDSRSFMWSVWIVDEREHPWMSGYEGLACPNERRVYLNSRYRSSFQAVLNHEWSHVEMWAHGVRGHVPIGTALHRAIEAIAQAAAKHPKKPAPLV